MRKPIHGLLARTVIVGALAVGAATPSHAVLIDFDTHSATGSVSGAAPAGAIVTNDYASQGIVFGKAGVSAGSAVVNNPNTFSLPNGACGLDLAANIVNNCTGDQYFHFVLASDGVTAAVTNSLSFVVGDSGGDLDGWILHVFDMAGVELEARPVQSISNTLQSFSHAGMHSVWIEWTNITPAGYLLDNISFDETTVPAPGSLALLLAGLGLIGFSRRRAA